MKKTFALKDLSNPAGGWVLVILLSLMLTGILAHTAIYVSMSHNDVLYEMRNLQRKLNEEHELLAKLEVEHSRLLSPYVLEDRAKELGMGQAKSGQIRRLDPHNTIQEESDDSLNTFILQRNPIE